jgi:hypothetical protein
MADVIVALPVPSNEPVVPVTSPVRAIVLPVARAVAAAARVAALAVPVKSAVIVPAVKLPEASRATIADAVLADAAVVAELDTLEAVEIVANLVSAIAALALISALRIVPSRIIVLSTVPVSVTLTMSARVTPCAVVVFSMCALASRKSLPIAICLTTAPAEWACADEPSMALVIVKVLVDTAVASTISSRAVSGSMTKVKVLPPGIVTPPSRPVPDTTVIVVSPEEIEPVSVDCWLRDEYWRVVIYIPIGD